MKQADKTYVKLGTRDFSTLAICAVRYSLGRQSYMPALVCEIIKKHIDEIDSSSLLVLQRDVREYLTTDGYTHSFSDIKDTWNKFLRFIEEKIDEAE